jgi:hypothetical protein
MRTGLEGNDRREALGSPWAASGDEGVEGCDLSVGLAGAGVVANGDDDAVGIEDDAADGRIWGCTPDALMGLGARQRQGGVERERRRCQRLRRWRRRRREQV